ncbi:MAG: glutathione S-transferase family protein [Gammaproteobacteria bacterium]|nr:glutathione S-transferase family protein [Gammaproteobacteria bacterium]
MKLYGMVVSPYVARVTLAATLKGLTLPATPPPGGGLKSAEYLALNPLGKIPALEVDGRVIPESMVILDYLEDAHPQPALLPTAALDRAQARLLGRIVDLYVMNSGGAFFRNMNPATRNEQEVESGKAAFLKSLAHLEHFMGAGPYAVGDRLGYGDVAILPCLLMMQNIVAAFGITDMYAGHSRLTRWWQQMQVDPAISAFIADYRVAVTNFLNRR